MRGFAFLTAFGVLCGLGSARAAVVITEVYVDTTIPSTEGDEFIELANTGAVAVSLGSYGLGTDVTPGTGGNDSFLRLPDITLAPGEVILVVKTGTEFASVFTPPVGVRVIACQGATGAQIPMGAAVTAWATQTIIQLTNTSKQIVLAHDSGGGVWVLDDGVSWGGSGATSVTPLGGVATTFFDTPLSMSGMEGKTFARELATTDTDTAADWLRLQVPSPGVAPLTVCGDAAVGSGETCDDGNDDGGDGCSASCQEECGYFCVGAGPGSCATECGDGDVAGDEECDDGGDLPGDGCSAACRADPGFVCAPACDGNAATLSDCEVDPCALPLHVTEVHVDGRVDESSEWIELTNAGAIPIDLPAWQVRDDAGAVTFPAGATLAPGETIVIAFAAAQYATDFGAAADFEYGADSDVAVPQLSGTAPRLDDTADEVALVCGGTARDIIRWAATPSATQLPSNAVDYSAANPSAGPDTYMRVGAAIDSGLASDFVTSRCPTPGEAAGDNHIPDAGPARLFASPGATHTFYLPAEDLDAEPLTFTIDTTGTSGTVVLVSAQTGEATFTPAGASGATSLRYTVSDACTTSPPITVDLVWGAPACTDSQLVISEVHIDAGDGNASEWFELTNVGTETATLAAHRVGDEESRGQPLGSSEGMFYFRDGAAIEPGEAVVIAFDGHAFEAQWGFLPDFEWNHDASPAADLLRAAGWSRGTIRLDEASDELVLANCLGVVDAIYWGPQPSAQPYTDPPWATRLPSPPPYAVDAPTTFVRNDVAIDTDSPADWALELCPSPGTATPPNRSPILGDNVTFVAGATLDGTLAASDPDDDPLEYALAAPALQAGQGTVTLTDADTGAFTFTAADGFVGVVSFGFTASDGCRVVSGTVTLCVGTSEVVGNTSDEDCDGVALCYIDEDGDGFGVTATTPAGPSGCDGAGRAPIAGDCDDAPLGCGAACNPGAPEICDGEDNDCSAATADGSEDEAVGDACDSPGDTNACTDDVQVCVPGTGLSCSNITAGDTTRVEVCDAADLDEDCDGGADDADPQGAPSNTTTFYRDQDGDNAGDDAVTQVACNRPNGYVTSGGDCADSPVGCGNACSPSLVEARANGNCADGFDNDCDDLIADQDPECFADAVCYPDADGDGSGAPGTSITLEGTDAGAGCAAYDDGVHPVGYWVNSNTDCDDDPAACGAACRPGLPDICDNRNNDCSAATADGSGDVTVGAPCDSPGDTDACLDELRVCTAGVLSCPNAPIGDAQRIEACDALDIDEDCDGGADDADPQGTPPTGSRTVFRDRDGDGRGVTGTTLTRCDVPAGYAAQGGDCDDAPEACGVACSPALVESKAAGNCDDGYSNDCDAAVDDDPECFTDILCYLDNDRDGFGDPTIEQLVTGAASEGGCAGYDDGTHPIGSWVASGADCDDNPAACGAACNPSRPELCDGYDTDCQPATADGSADPAVGVSCDSAGDGDACTDDRQSCQGGELVCVNIPTNDANQIEICDEAPFDDEDCDGGADDADPDGSPSATTWYRDADEDGFGDPSTGQRFCVAPAGRVSNGGDCADDPAGCGAACHAGAAEICDGFDSDCRADTIDGVDDDDVGVPCDSPADQDQCLDEVSLCSGTVVCPNDPEGDLQRIEVCDAADADEDCDGGADDADPQGAPTAGASIFHRDADGDGHGDPAEVLSACDEGPGRTTTQDDCDDDPTACGADCHPLVVEEGELCADDYDNDCDDTTDTDPSCVTATVCHADNDGDGFGVDDATAGLPTGVASCAVFDDGDHPVGYWVLAGGDCDDDDEAIHPGASEVPGNDDDEDCNGANACWVDADDDGYAADDAAVQDVAADTTCEDAFGFAGRQGDCDDDPEQCGGDCSPALAEVCDERDNDCDASVDELAACQPESGESEIVLNGGSGCASGPDAALGWLVAALVMWMARRRSSRDGTKVPRA